MRRLLASSLLVTLASASFCGDSAIPYSLEVLPNGQPILGCARPTCFGWAPNGQPASNTGSFYRINEHADGFIRAGPHSVPAFGPADARYYKPQTAMCDAFLSSSCAAANQWVGGIAPSINVTLTRTALQCCSYDGLLLSEDRGQASLHGGQIVVGGEVFSGRLQVAFDYISDVAMVVGANGSVQYDVSIRRMACADHAGSDGSAKVPKTNGAQAFQEPIVAVEEPLPLPPAGPIPPAAPATPDDGTFILEELVQEEAVQLPPGTQFQPNFQQPLPPPPPQFQAPPQFVPPPQAPPQFVPQPPVQYAPVYTEDSLWCFSEDMTVQTMDGTEKRMDELNKQDWVLAVEEDQLVYVRVEFWLHRVPEQRAVFNEFETEDGKTIKLTDKHFIYKGDCSRVGAGSTLFSELPKEAVTADRVHAGDCLFTLGEDELMHEVRVVRADKVTQTGIYAPMTSNGRIIVNGIHASCHNIMQSNTMGQTVIEVVNNLHDYIFGSSSEEEVVETPYSLSTLLEMADLIIPKNLVTI